MFQFALPRGERHGDDARVRTAFLFQFALPRGERHFIISGSGVASLFQFALPRGERHRCHSGGTQHAGFNSRSREGSDVSSIT